MSQTDENTAPNTENETAPATDAATEAETPAAEETAPATEAPAAEAPAEESDEVEGNLSYEQLQARAKLLIKQCQEVGCDPVALVKEQAGLN